MIPEQSKDIVEEYKSTLMKKFESILGTEGLDFEYKMHNKDIFIKLIKWERKEPTDNFKSLLNFLMSLLEKYYSIYSECKNSFEKSIVVDKICSIFIYSLILNSSQKEKKELENIEYDEYNELKNFISDLVELASKTYEQRICTASFILMENCDVKEIDGKLKDLNIDFLEFQDNEYINVNDIHKYSKAYRLIDSLSLSYVINKNYKIIGIAKKRRNHKSIKEIFSNSKDTAFQFIYLEDKKIYWLLDKDRILIAENCQWKLKDYDVIKSILKKGLKDKKDIDEEKEKQKEKQINDQVDIFCNIIKDLSNSNTGALFVILDKSYYTDGKIRTYRDQTILKNILKSEKIDTSTLYKKVIRNENSNITINQKVDPYLIKLIADVDGAVIFNKKLTLLDFGRMIEPQNIEENNGVKNSKKIFSNAFVNVIENNVGDFKEELEKVSGGARSIATFHASTFGLAIKISEDGGILIYDRRRLILKL